MTRPRHAPTRIGACPGLRFKSVPRDADVTRMEYVSRCPACSALVRRDQDWCTLVPRGPAPTRAASVRRRRRVDRPHRLGGPAARNSVAPARRAPRARRGAARPGRAGRKHARPSAVEVPAVRPRQAGGRRDRSARSSSWPRSPDPVSGLMSRPPESQSMRVILALMVGGAVVMLRRACPTSSASSSTNPGGIARPLGSRRTESSIVIDAAPRRRDGGHRRPRGLSRAGRAT